jgi:hypothetical protein
MPVLLPQKLGLLKLHRAFLNRLMLLRLFHLFDLLFFDSSLLVFPTLFIDILRLLIRVSLHLKPFILHSLPLFVKLGPFPLVVLDSPQLVFIDSFAILILALFIRVAQVQKVLKDFVFRDACHKLFLQELFVQRFGVKV